MSEPDAQSLPAPVPEANPLDRFDALTPKERAFCFKYLECFDHGDAAESVGMARGTGRNWLLRPLIADFLKHLTKDQEQYMVINRAYVQSLQIELADKLMGKEEVPIVTEKGEEFLAKKFFAGQAVTHVQNIAKQVGLSAPELKISPVSIDIDLEALGVGDKNIKTSITIEQTRVEEKNVIEGVIIDAG